MEDLAAIIEKLKTRTIGGDDELQVIMAIKRVMDLRPDLRRKLSPADLSFLTARAQKVRYQRDEVLQFARDASGHEHKGAGPGGGQFGTGGGGVAPPVAGVKPVVPVLPEHDEDGNPVKEHARLSVHLHQRAAKDPHFDYAEATAHAEHLKGLSKEQLGDILGHIPSFATLKDSKEKIIGSIVESIKQRNVNMERTGRKAGGQYLSEAPGQTPKPAQSAHPPAPQGVSPSLWQSLHQHQAAGDPHAKALLEHLGGLVKAKEISSAVKPKDEKAPTHKYEAIKKDLDSLSIEQMRDRFHETFKDHSKEDLSGVLKELGYNVSGSRKDMHDQLLDNLTSIKLSKEQTKQIRNLPRS